MNRLSAENLALAYDNTLIINALNLTIPTGKITALVGPNGCGKSTLLRGLARLLAPKRGHVYLDGKAIHRMPTKDLAKQIGILPQSPVAQEGLTVRELVAQGRYPHQSWFQQWSKSDDLLTQIAPTVAQPGDYVDYGIPWQELTLTVGKAVGQVAEAEAFVADVEAQFAQVQVDHPEFTGATSVVATPYQGIWVYGEQDVRGRFLTMLGFQLPAGLQEVTGTAFGGNLSMERADLLLLAPDPIYSQPGYRRVIYYERPAGLFAHYAQQEYLIPEADTGRLLWALFEAKAMLPQFDTYRVNNDHEQRDILVCTHGTIDVACAKFGYPLYRHLRDTYADDHLRVWRVSHFGGHVFAPTLMDMPTGHFWADIGEAQAVQIVQRQGDVAKLRCHYRGWAGVPAGFAQAAERELWQETGWAWFAYAKQGEGVDQDLDPERPTWADVQITYQAPHEKTGGAIVHVAVEKWLETAGTTGHPETDVYAQYTGRLENRPHACGTNTDEKFSDVGFR